CAGATGWVVATVPPVTSGCCETVSGVKGCGVPGVPLSSGSAPSESTLATLAAETSRRLRAASRPDSAVAIIEFIEMLQYRHGARIYCAINTIKLANSWEK